MYAFYKHSHIEFTKETSASFCISTPTFANTSGRGLWRSNHDRALDEGNRRLGRQLIRLFKPGPFQLLLIASSSIFMISVVGLLTLSHTWL